MLLIGTDGAHIELCKIYCKNWSRMNLSDITAHLYDKFISHLKNCPLKLMSNNSDEKLAISSSAAKIPSAQEQLTESLPQPHGNDIQEATTYTPTSDPDNLNAVV